MMLVIFGPTVTGKTSLAIKLAKTFKGEIISADSRQIYKSLDIGSGKVSTNSNVSKFKDYWLVDGVKIYGFDIINPGDEHSAANFSKYAQVKIKEILKTNKLPILVGGSGFYIKSTLYGIDTFGVSKNKILRAKLEKLSATKLYERLIKLNPKRASSMNESDRKNPRRLIRAIEIATSGFTNKTADKHLSHNHLVIGLTAKNNYLYDKADNWLNERLKSGMVNEVSQLIASGIAPMWLDNLGLEYRWIKRHLVDKINYEDAIVSLKGDIHNLIRRQKTFFNQFENIITHDISKKDWIDDLEGDLKRLLGRE